ncbi:glycosyltransferase family 4 protein [Motilimonas pumila]|nr:glycosyltransferase family 4 protein [Motilimonas pumila]
MKVILLLDSRGFGGIESHVMQLAFGLKAHRQAVEVWLLKDYGRHPLSNKLQQQGITMDHVNGGIRALYRKLATQTDAIVHSHGYKAGIASRLVCKILSIRCFSTFHAGERGRGKMAIYQWLDEHTAGLATSVFAVSQPIKLRLPANCELVNNFIHLPPWPMQLGHEVAFVGRLSDEKAPHRLLSMAQALPECHYAFYGDGPLLSHLRPAAPENVSFYGQQTNMEARWKNIQVLIICSRQEGLPMVAIEAMARGIIVIAFELGALANLIDDGINGWLVAGQNPADLTLKLHAWRQLSTPQQARMRQQARHKVAQTFSDSAVIPQLLRRYHAAF